MPKTFKAKGGGNNKYAVSAPFAGRFFIAVRTPSPKTGERKSARAKPDGLPLTGC